MEHHVRVEVGCTDFDVVYNLCQSRGEVEFPKEIRYPMELSSHGSDRSVFNFSRGPSNYMLFLRTPRDRIEIKIDNEGFSRGKIILVSSLVNVQGGM